MKKLKKFIPIIIGILCAFIVNTQISDSLGLIQLLITDIVICLFSQLVLSRVFK